MGKTITPKYRVEISYISFTEKRIKTDSFAWDIKRHGKPTNENAKKFRDAMNESLNKGGSNENLRDNQSDYCNTEIKDQKTGEVIAEFIPPLFEVLN